MTTHSNSSKTSGPANPGPAYPRIILKPGREKPVLARHPWVFSGAVASHDDAQDGQTVDVCAADGRFLARGYWNSRSQMCVRIWTWDNEPVDALFLRQRLESAVQARARAGLEFRPDPAAPPLAFRLVNAESDLLPGIVVDAYAGFLVAQFLTRGADTRKQEIVRALAELLGPRGLYERSDVDVREKEGLEPVAGTLCGEPPPERLEILEDGRTLLVDIRKGQKTGAYLDQRENRATVARHFAALRPPADQTEAIVLNAFSYTGAFGLHIGAANPCARVLNLDSSADALALARENFARNALDARAEFLHGDAFVVLRRFRDEARAFDGIVLDPPKFAFNQARLENAARGYKDTNLLAIKLLRPGGLLATFSCSGLVSSDLFQKIVAGAAADAGRQVQILARLGHPPDHPCLLSFPEGEYLKGMILRVL